MFFAQIITMYDLRLLYFGELSKIILMFRNCFWFGDSKKSRLVLSREYKCGSCALEAFEFVIVTLPEQAS